MQTCFARDMKSRMKREFHVRFCESLKGKFLGATRLTIYPYSFGTGFYFNSDELFRLLDPSDRNCLDSTISFLCEESNWVANSQFIHFVKPCNVHEILLSVFARNESKSFVFSVPLQLYPSIWNTLPQGNYRGLVVAQKALQLRGSSQWLSQNHLHCLQLTCQLTGAGAAKVLFGYIVPNRKNNLFSIVFSGNQRS